MRVSDTNKNRGAHGDSSFKLCGLPSSSENPPALAVGSVKGKYVRVYTDGWGATITKIGNIISDKWFDIKEFFSEGST